MAKTCAACQVTFENVEEAFSKHRRMKDGFASKCRSCKHVYEQAYYHADVGRARARRNRDYHADPEKGRAQRRAWYQRNRERRSAETLAYHKAHPEQHLAQVKRWMKANPEKVRKWHRVAAHNRTARKRGGEGGITAKDIRRLYDSQRGLCFWCDELLTPENVQLDHVVPLLLKGEHSVQNIVLACDDCNQRKHAKHPAVFNPERWERFQRERSVA